jgi:hypothetical protein
MATALPARRRPRSIRKLRLFGHASRLESPGGCGFRIPRPLFVGPRVGRSFLPTSSSAASGCSCRDDVRASRRPESWVTARGSDMLRFMAVVPGVLVLTAQPALGDEFKCMRQNPPAPTGGAALDAPSQVRGDGVGITRGRGLRDVQRLSGRPRLGRRFCELLDDRRRGLAAAGLKSTVDAVALGSSG